MATNLRKRRKRRASRPRYLFIEEWMDERGVGDDGLAARIGVARETVTRYRSQQHRLNPDKIKNVANALGLEPWQLWNPPATDNQHRPSIDAMLHNEPDDIVRKAAEITAVLLRDNRAR